MWNEHGMEERLPGGELFQTARKKLIRDAGWYSSDCRSKRTCNCRTKLKEAPNAG